MRQYRKQVLPKLGLIVIPLHSSDKSCLNALNFTISTLYSSLLNQRVTYKTRTWRSRPWRCAIVRRWIMTHCHDEFRLGVASTKHKKDSTRKAIAVRRAEILSETRGEQYTSISMITWSEKKSNRYLIISQFSSENGLYYY
jgi:hypothetical protein